MPKSVFVFSALHEEKVAFSVQEDGANIPRAASGAPWRPAFRTAMTESSLGMFKVNARKVVAALQAKGFYVGRPVDGVPLYRSWQDKIENSELSPATEF
jgi:hypothetical protein